MRSQRWSSQAQSEDHCLSVKIDASYCLASLSSAPRSPDWPPLMLYDSTSPLPFSTVSCCNCPDSLLGAPKLSRRRLADPWSVGRAPVYFASASVLSVARVGFSDLWFCPGATPPAYRSQNCRWQMIYGARLSLHRVTSTLYRKLSRRRWTWAALQGS